MRAKRTIWLKAAAAAGVWALFAGGTIARAAEQDEAGGGFGIHRGHRGGPMLRGLKALRQLDLSEQQRAEIRSVLQAEREAGREEREALMGARRELRQAIHDGAEEPVLRDKAATLGVHAGDMAVRAAAIRAQIRTVLTEEQNHQLEQLRAEAQERVQERRQRMKQRWQMMREKWGGEAGSPGFLER